MEVKDVLDIAVKSGHLTNGEIFPLSEDVAGYDFVVDFNPSVKIRVNNFSISEVVTSLLLHRSTLNSVDSVGLFGESLKLVGRADLVDIFDLTIQKP